jgi:hypothetical protein
MNSAALFTKEMAMIEQVGTIPGRRTIEVDLFDKAVGYEGVQAVIDCCQRDSRHVFLGTYKYLNGSRMIPLLHQDGENLFALSG